MTPRIAAAAMLLAVTGCASVSEPVVLQGEGLGSTWSVKIAGPATPDTAALRAGIQQRIDEVSRQINRWDTASTLSHLNEARTEEWQPVSSALLDALSYALSLAADTGGAFDPTVAPLVDAWGFGTAGRRFEPPTAQAISAARERTGWNKVTLDTAARRVRRPAGLQIDLSSMTHGYAADQVATYLKSAGVRSYLVDVGSEIRANGSSPEGRPWRIAIERPPEGSSSEDAPRTPQRVIALRDAGVATSGNYRYYFDYGGRRYSHRIDPRTGEPVTHPLASVTVIDEQCMRADALATALTVLGPEEGFAFAERHNVAALFILQTSHGLQERMTPSFAAYLN